MTSSDQEIREHVREKYAAAALAVVSGSAASCCGPSEGAQTSCCGPSDALTAISDTEEGDIFGAALYTPGETDGLPEEAVLASLGCGNPLAVAELRDGERVLDLGSGGGIDVLLSARRVGPTGFAYGLDMTDEMLDLARANAVKAGAANVEFVKGQIEDIPLPDASIDVVISNCVINLSTDKPAVLAEMFRVLTPGGRLGISDVVAEDGLTAGGPGRTRLLRRVHRRRPVPLRIPRRADRGRLHRTAGGVHPRGRPRHARRHRPRGQARRCCHGRGVVVSRRGGAAAGSVRRPAADQLV